MLTKSSLLPLVVMEPSEAGWPSTRFSATSAAAVTCAIISPDSSPAMARQERRQVLVQTPGFTSRSMRRSEMPASAASATARKSSWNASGSP